MTPRGGALVTGGARRIGRVLALRAAALGYAVAIHHRSAEADANAVKAEIEAAGGRAAVVLADLSMADVATPLIDAARDAVGPLSLLVNNASLFEDDRIETLTAASWEAHMAANLRAPVLLAQAFAAQAPDGALIVNLLDQRVWRPTPQFFSYSVSKAALWRATRTLAQALAPRIRVNAIGPGPTLPSIHQSEAAFAAEADRVPLKRRATPEEIADALAYLVDAPSVTGQMIAVDAGQHLAWQTPDVSIP
ncbi:MAG TPA: SDR family oxidoreductase [Caulobacteraceae bacterium]|nr:SDR family oxidoreductase [Caulobacteraceae bacterium]